MFIDVAGEVHRIVSKSEGGAWIISYEKAMHTQICTGAGIEIVFQN